MTFPRICHAVKVYKNRISSNSYQLISYSYKVMFFHHRDSVTTRWSDQLSGR